VRFITGRMGTEYDRERRRITEPYSRIGMFARFVDLAQSSVFLDSPIFLVCKVYLSNKVVKVKIWAAPIWFRKETDPFSRGTQLVFRVDSFFRPTSMAS